MNNNEVIIADTLNLLGSDGNFHKLEDYSGKKIILYFYPRDNTPACTNEAIMFRDNHEALEKLNCVVFGVSRDSIKTHENFIAKYNLNFLLLSDRDEIACNLFGVLKEKSMYGKKSIGIERSTFIFDEKGHLIKSFRKIKVDTHLEEILNFLKKKNV